MIGWKGQENVARMDAERLVKILMENTLISAGRSPGRPKRRWSALTLD